MPKINAVNSIRCIEQSYAKTSPKGYFQKVNKCVTKDGQKITEIITEFGNGKQGVREILADALGEAQVVTDKVCGRVEKYTFDGKKVIQESEEGIITHFPVSVWQALTMV